MLNLLNDQLPRSAVELIKALDAKFPQITPNEVFTQTQTGLLKRASERALVDGLLIQYGLKETVDVSFKA